MLYLVQGELVETEYVLPPQQFAEYVENRVVPYWEAMTKLEAEGKVRAGGVPAGSRSATFIVDAASNDEVTEILVSLPIWAWCKWQVTPLESFQHRLNQSRQVLTQARGTLQ